MRLHQLTIFLCALIINFHQPANWLQLLLLHQRHQDKEIWSNQRLQGTHFFLKRVCLQLQLRMNWPFKWRCFIFSLSGAVCCTVCTLLCADARSGQWPPLCTQTEMNRRRDRDEECNRNYMQMPFKETVCPFYIRKMLTQTKCFCWWSHEVLNQSLLKMSVFILRLSIMLKLIIIIKGFKAKHLLL